MTSLRPRPQRPALRRLAVSLAASALILTTAACGDGEEESGAETEPAGACDYTEGPAPAARQVDAPPGDLPEDAPTSVTIETDQGSIPVSLDAEAAPCAVNSFLSLADQGFYDDTVCHRLVTGGLNVLQCGDPSATGAQGPGYAFADELVEDDARLQPCLDQVDPSSGQEVCTYTAGTVAMANSGPDTNGSQFFLVFDDSPLGNAYTVFGRMSAGGLQVVQDVAEGGIAADGTAPATTTTIESVEE